MSALMLMAGKLHAQAAHDHEHKHKHEHKHAHADESRQHGAHVHGVAQLNLVQEGEAIHIEFSSPAMNIVGFEHAPASQADRAALDRAVRELSAVDGLLAFNAEARCEADDAKIASALLGEPSAGAAAEPHADIDAAYHFVCAAPGRLQRLDVTLFDRFPALQEIQVQFIVGERQGAARLTSSERVVTF